MNILFWDTFSGLSGDMALGSLIAAGAEVEEIEKAIKSTGLTSFSLEANSKKVNGITAIDFNVIIQDTEQHHRHLNDIKEIISQGSYSDKVKENALAVFTILGKAEAKIHGIELNKVHFHEVGAVDSIVDILGTCIALDILKIEKIVVTSLPWSRGFVNCDHGKLPIPAPATLEILTGFRFYDSKVEGELITPTGAALIKALGTQDDFPLMSILRTGYGCGNNYYGIPNILRAVIGEEI